MSIILDIVSIMIMHCIDHIHMYMSSYRYPVKYSHAAHACMHMLIKVIIQI